MNPGTAEAAAKADLGNRPGILPAFPSLATIRERGPTADANAHAKDPPLFSLGHTWPALAYTMIWAWCVGLIIGVMAGVVLVPAVLDGFVLHFPSRKVAFNRRLRHTKLLTTFTHCITQAAIPRERTVTRSSITDGGSTAGSPEASTSYKDDKREELKKTVIRSVANTNRGKATTPDRRRQILEVIKDLELLNPTPDPINSPLLNGLWSLLYTAPIEDEVVDKFAGVEEGPFLARLKPLSFGSVKQTRSSQVIDTVNGVAENIADFTFFGLDGSLTIRGAAEKAPATSSGAVRLNVTFENFTVQLGSWRSPTISLSWVRPKGWVETTFLDSTFRIGRGDKGSVFVAARRKQSD